MHVHLDTSLAVAFESRIRPDAHARRPELLIVVDPHPGGVDPVTGQASVLQSQVRRRETESAPPAVTRDDRSDDR